MIRALFALSGVMIAGGIYSVVAGLDYIVLERGWTMVLAGTTAATGGAILLGLTILVREVARQAPAARAVQAPAGQRSDIMDRLAAMKPARPEPVIDSTEPERADADVAASRLHDDLVASRQDSPAQDAVAKPAATSVSLLDRLTKSRLSPQPPAATRTTLADTLAMSGLRPPPVEPPATDDAGKDAEGEPHDHVPVEAVRVGASVAGIVVTSAPPPPEEPGDEPQTEPSGPDPRELGPFVMEPEERPESDIHPELAAPLAGLSSADRLIAVPPAADTAQTKVAESDADLFADDTAEKADEPAPEPSVVGSYAAGGHTYVMYSDGSIQAETAVGLYRFASIDELKTFISTGEMPARGPLT